MEGVHKSALLLGLAYLPRGAQIVDRLCPQPGCRPPIKPPGVKVSADLVHEGCQLRPTSPSFWDAFERLCYLFRLRRCCLRCRSPRCCCLHLMGALAVCEISRDIMLSEQKVCCRVTACPLTPPPPHTAIGLPRHALPRKPIHPSIHSASPSNSSCFLLLTSEGSNAISSGHRARMLTSTA